MNPAKALLAALAIVAPAPAVALPLAVWALRAFLRWWATSRAPAAPAVVWGGAALLDFLDRDGWSTIWTPHPRVFAAGWLFIRRKDRFADSETIETVWSEEFGTWVVSPTDLFSAMARIDHRAGRS